MNGTVLTDQVSILFPKKLSKILVAIKHLDENDLTRQAVYCLSPTEYQEFMCKHHLEIQQYTGPLKDNELLAEMLKSYLLKREAENFLRLTAIKID